MNICFYLPPDANNIKKWDGYNIRYGNVGCSGSHTAVVAAAEALAKTGLTVYVHNFCTDNKVNDVQYVGNYQQLVDKDITHLVIPSWFANSAIIQDMKHTLKHIYIWLHCIPQKIDYPILNIPVTYIHLSEWSKSILPQTNNKSIVANNILLVDVLPSIYTVTNTQKQNTTIFCACIERGGIAAEIIWNKLNKLNPANFKNFQKFTYDRRGKANDKFTLCNVHLLNAKYFIYPLVANKRPYCVHVDTFSYVVAEAIACGIEVFTYPVGALKELYDGMVTWLPFPNNFNPGNKPFIHCKHMLDDTYTSQIANIIHEFDQTYHDRQQTRIKNAVKVRTKFAQCTWINEFL